MENIQKIQLAEATRDQLTNSVKDMQYEIERLNLLIEMINKNIETMKLETFHVEHEHSTLKTVK